MTETSKKVVAAGVSVGVGAGALALFKTDPSAAIQYILDICRNQMAQAGFFFTLAAWLHSGRVKKEIAKNFMGMTDAMNNIATVLSRDLKKHGERLDNLTDRVETLETVKTTIRGDVNA